MTVEPPERANKISNVRRTPPISQIRENLNLENGRGEPADGRLVVDIPRISLTVQKRETIRAF
jgi:hypothetical protein